MDKKTYSCDQCDKTYHSSQSNLEKHKLKVHGNRQLWVCADCDQIFALERDLYLHVFQVHKKSESWKENLIINNEVERVEKSG